MAAPTRLFVSISGAPRGFSVVNRRRVCQRKSVCEHGRRRRGRASDLFLVDPMPRRLEWPHRRAQHLTEVNDSQVISSTALKHQSSSNGYACHTPPRASCDTNREDNRVRVSDADSPRRGPSTSVYPVVRIGHNGPHRSLSVVNRRGGCQRMSACEHGRRRRGLASDLLLVDPMPRRFEWPHRRAHHLAEVSDSQVISSSAFQHQSSSNGYARHAPPRASCDTNAGDQRAAALVYVS